MQHAVSVSPWGFIQVVIASTIRAKGTLFLRCKVGDSLHPWMVWGLLPVWNARVYYWYGRMTAGGRPSQLPAAPELSCARLRPRPGSLKTVNTHQLRPDRCNRRTLTPGPESHILLLPWQPCRQSKTQCTICCDHTLADPGHQPLSGHSHHVHPLWHLDGRFLQGRRVAVVVSKMLN